MATLDGDSYELYAQVIHRVAYLRARQGLPVVAIAGIIQSGTDLARTPIAKNLASALLTAARSSTALGQPS